ncbi:MAG: tyrosine-type recombinase/integrase [Gemmatimonadota bacterium]|nr:tyrosine-type recombinase/integrase [Gemmatimonadota bacterium]
MLGPSWPGAENRYVSSSHARDQWRVYKKGTWACSLGRRGCRVRLFQITKGGFFYREVHVPGCGKDRVSLHTRERSEAERLGRVLLASLLSGVAPKLSAVVRLSDLASAFTTEAPMFLDNSARTKADSLTRIAILRAALGDATDVRTLTEHHIRQYEARRRAGGIPYGPHMLLTPVVRQRSVQSDVKLLKQMLYWACTRPMPDSGPWLERNPIAHVRVKGEVNVQRPVASLERFEATRSAMQDMQARYSGEARMCDSAAARARGRRRYLSWVRAEFGLMLLEATGRRRGAIMGLRWSDFDFEARRVTWRPEHDKKKRSWLVSYSEEFFATVREFRRRLEAVGGYVFPRADDGERPALGELLSQRIRQAEEAAALPKLVGGTCHPYRRKWRSERSHHPLKAVAVAGGWTDFDTMLRCYDQPDDTDLLAVTSEPRKRRELSLAHGAKNN